MILTNSGRAVVDTEGDCVVKTFSDKLMFIKEKFAYMTFPTLCAKLVRIDNDDCYITTKRGVVLRDWLLTNPSDSHKMVVKEKIILLLKNLHDMGYVHCDVHIDNVIIYPMLDVRLIDFEHLRCRSNKDFFKDIDMVGASYICAFDNSPRSIKTALGDFK